MPILMTQQDLLAQAAALSTTTIFTTVVAGQYRLSWNAKRTTADTVSSTLGALTVTYVDPDATTVTYTMPAIVAAGTVATTNATDSTTSTGALIGIPLMLNCGAATAVTIAMAYISNTPGNMKYNLHVKLELMFST